MDRYFDAIYVINLPSRRDRRSQIKDQFKRVGVDPDLMPVIFFDAVRPTDAGGFPNIGARGCFMSHLGVFRAAQSAGHQQILVLEDDTDFSQDFVKRFGSLVKSLDQTAWGMWYLGALEISPPNPEKTPLAALSPSSSVRGTHMYAAKAHAIAALIPYLEAMLARQPGDPAGGPMHVDGALSWFRRQHPEVLTMSATRVLGHQRPSRTDIHQLKWFDRLPAVKNAVAMMRSMRSRVASGY